MFDKNRWIEILAQALPGELAHSLMTPSFRGEFISRENPLQAAVMSLFYYSEKEIRLVFIKRNQYDGPHSAQVSFPGGAWEAGDHSLEETALRETREELGVNGQIEVLGALTPLHIPVSNFLVHPFVVDPARRESEIIYHHQRTIEAPFYRVGQEKIWGATAMILSEVLHLASGLQ